MTMKVVSASEDLLPTSALQITCRKCRKGRRSWHTGRPSQFNHHKVQNGDRFKQDKGDNKQPKWLLRVIKIKGQRLEGVENFKYLGTIISNDENPRFFPG